MFFPVVIVNVSRPLLFPPPPPPSRNTEFEQEQFLVVWGFEHVCSVAKFEYLWGGSYMSIDGVTWKVGKVFWLLMVQDALYCAFLHLL